MNGQYNGDERAWVHDSNQPGGDVQTGIYRWFGSHNNNNTIITYLHGSIFRPNCKRIINLAPSATVPIPTPNVPGTRYNFRYSYFASNKLIHHVNIINFLNCEIAKQK